MSKILIVDDDKLIVSALSIRLRAEGHDIVAAYDGMTAVQQAKGTNPDLIIMDINLPFSNGLRSVRQIREATGTSETPVIFLTASKVSALRQQAESLGAAGFLEKPYDATELLALVKSSLTAPALPAADSRVRSARGGGRKILVVDDGRKIVDALAVDLKAEGYQILTASDETSALEQAKKHHPALMVMDSTLAHANDLKATLQNQGGVGPETPVVLVEKPFETAELAARIHHVLEEPVQG
jgi:DNA-binding response OmpR family regulator